MRGTTMSWQHSYGRERRAAQDAEYDDLPLRAVMIKWIDSFHSTSWVSLEERDELPDVAECYSVAWLVDEDDQQVRITLSQSIDDYGDCQISGVMAVPKDAIIEMKPLLT